MGHSLEEAQEFEMKWFLTESGMTGFGALSKASDADKVYANNAEATYLALCNGAKGLPVVQDLLATRHDGVNAYYSAPKPK
jgi:formaldehyde-activating enzyme involved in methanogenesis